MKGSGEAKIKTLEKLFFDFRDEVASRLSYLEGLRIDFCPNCNHDTVHVRKQICNYDTSSNYGFMSASSEAEVSQCSVCGKLWKNEASKVEHKLGE